MQTFLPSPSFVESARVLDPLRLGKQRVEALQILRAITFDDYGWRSHPAVLMWRGFGGALAHYAEVVTLEWIARGHADRVLAQVREFGPDPDAPRPAWLGEEALHRSHRSALVRKDPEWYRPSFPDVPDDLPYVWPEPAPAPPSRTDRPSAWVVRPPGDPAVWRSDDVVALPPLPEGPRARKAARQVEAFRERAAVGDLLLASVGDRLVVGEILGPPTDRNVLDPQTGRRVLDPQTGRHVRPARWTHELPRASLRRPAYLQDPRVFFALYDEPALGAAPTPRAVTGGGSTRRR